MKGQENREKSRKMLDQYFARISQIPQPFLQGGWIRTIRQSLKMTESELANRMGMTQAALHRIERKELEGKIQIDTLRRAADALNCDLRISVVPRVPLEESFFNRALELARVELKSVHQTMKLEDQAPSDPSGLDQWLAQELIRKDQVHW